MHAASFLFVLRQSRCLGANNVGALSVVFGERDGKHMSSVSLHRKRSKFRLIIRHFRLDLFCTISIPSKVSVVRNLVRSPCKSNAKIMQCA